MDTKAIREILNLINKSDLTEVEIEQKDFKIRVKKGSAEESIVYSSIQMQPQMPQQHLQAYPQPVPQQLTESNPASPPKEDAVANVVAAADEKLHTFKSPMIGTFYRASGPDKDVFVNVGDSISPGKVVCI